MHLELSTGRQRQEDPWRSLARQLSLRSEPQSSKRSRLRNLDVEKDVSQLREPAALPEGPDLVP